MVNTHDVSIATKLSSNGNGSALTGLTKAQVGLGNVDNTSDVNKPISTATQTALNLKAPLVSPVLTGTPTAPTPVNGDISQNLATTAFVEARVASAAGSVGCLQVTSQTDCNNKLTSYGIPKGIGNFGSSIRTIQYIGKFYCGVGGIYLYYNDNSTNSINNNQTYYPYSNFYLCY